MGVEIAALAERGAKRVCLAGRDAVIEVAPAGSEDDVEQLPVGVVTGGADHARGHRAPFGAQTHGASAEAHRVAERDRADESEAVEHFEEAHRLAALETPDVDLGRVDDLAGGAVAPGAAADH